nr:MAG TPA: alpha-1, 3-glucanase [Caudoviricetes sp.]
MPITPNDPADFGPTLGNYTELKPFRYWCQKVLPLVYNDSLSYYELLCKVINYLNVTMQDVEALDEDVNALNNAYVQLQSYVNNYFSSLDVQQEINNKLDQMVESGTFTQLLKGYLPFITLSMYGAHEDGVSDDSTYLQQALNDSASTGVTLYIERNIAIGSTINIPSNAKIASYRNNRNVSIFAIDGVTQMFICSGNNNLIENINLYPYGTTYKHINGILFNASDYNSDTILKNVQIGYMYNALEIHTRNVMINGCSFTHCNYGVTYDFESGSQFRGCNIENCRFHGIGEELELSWFETSACIRVLNRQTANLTIRNCISEQSGTFINGYLNNMLVENNFVESFAGDIIIISNDTPTTPENNGVISLIGNMFTGKQGQVSETHTAPYPNHIININNVYRVNIINNVIKLSNKELIIIGNSQDTAIQNNTLLGNDLSGSGGGGVNINNSQITLQNNYFVNIDTPIEQTNSTILNWVGNNIPALTDATYSYNDTWVVIGEGNSNSPLNFSLPKEFLVTTSDGETAFICVRSGNYYNGGIKVAPNGTSFLSLTFINNDGIITPLLQSFTIPELVRTPLSTSLVFYRMVK